MASKKHVVSMHNYAKPFGNPQSNFIKSYNGQHMRKTQFERVRKVHQPIIQNVSYQTNSAIVTLSNGRQAEVFFK